MDRAEIVELVIAKAEQACRDVLERQDFKRWPRDTVTGFQMGARACESYIREYVLAHIAGSDYTPGSVHDELRGVHAQQERLGARIDAIESKLDRILALMETEQ